jgi:hypothetical protein
MIVEVLHYDRERGLALASRAWVWLIAFLSVSVGLYQRSQVALVAVAWYISLSLLSLLPQDRFGGSFQKSVDNDGRACLNADLSP